MDFLKDSRMTLSSQEDGREMTIVMILKIGKDLSVVKGWRPIILMSCLLKLMDKVVVRVLQQLDVFYHRQYGSRKGKAAIDIAIQATTEAQLSVKKGKQVVWALGDVKSAFNYVQKDTVLAKLKGHKDNGLMRYLYWFFQPKQATISWNGENQSTTTIGAGVPQGSPLSPVVFLITIAKALEDADIWISWEIPTHLVKTYSYIDDFHCIAREKGTLRHRGRKPDSITVTRKARDIVTEELEANGWSRDPDKNKEINFRVAGEAKWIGVTFTHDLNWKNHNN